MKGETIAQLKRLTRAVGKPQAELLQAYVSSGYQAALADPKYGPVLRLLEPVAAQGF